MKICNHDTVIFLGDSVTDCDRSRGDNGEGSMGSNAYGGGYPRFFVSLFRVLHPDMNVRFLNKGCGGEQTRHVLARLQSDVLDYHPDVVTLCIGINDVWRASTTCGGALMCPRFPVRGWMPRNTAPTWSKSSREF